MERERWGIHWGRGRRGEATQRVCDRISWLASCHPAADSATVIEIDHEKKTVWEEVIELQ